MGVEQERFRAVLVMEDQFIYCKTILIDQYHMLKLISQFWMTCPLLNWGTVPRVFAVGIWPMANSFFWNSSIQNVHNCFWQSLRENRETISSAICKSCAFILNLQVDQDSSIPLMMNTFRATKVEEKSIKMDHDTVNSPSKMIHYMIINLQIVFSIQLLLFRFWFQSAIVMATAIGGLAVQSFGIV